MEFIPFANVADVPDNMKSLEGITLTLEQINLLAEIKHNLSLEGKVDDIDYDAEWTFRDMFMLKDGAWVKRPPDKLYEGMERVGLKIKGGLVAAKEYCNRFGIDYHDKAMKEDVNGVAFLYLHEIGSKTRVREKTLSPGITAIYAKSEDVDEMRTVDITAVEIFAAGTWTDSSGTEFTTTVNDLQGMVDADGVFDAPVKLGHSDGQDLLNRSGFPAAGWVKNLRVAGEKLLADLISVPKLVADFIKTGAFKNRSIEITPDFKDESTGTIWERVVTGLALLGEELPALNNLQEIKALYNGQPFTPEIFTYKLENNEIKQDGGVLSMTEKEIAEMRAENARLKVEKETLEGKTSEYEKSESEKADAKVKADAEKADLEKKVSDFEAEKATADELVEKEAVKEFKALIAEKLEPAEHEPIVEGFIVMNAEGREKVIAMYKAMKTHEDLKEKGADADPEHGKHEGGDEAAKFKKDMKDHAEDEGLDLKTAQGIRDAVVATATYVRPTKFASKDMKYIDDDKGGGE